MNVDCSSTYTLTGAETLECQSGGTWNASVGTCEKGKIYLGFRLTEIPFGHIRMAKRQTSLRSDASSQNLRYCITKTRLFKYIENFNPKN